MSKQKSTILIAEDHLDVRSVLIELLNLNDFQPLPAEDGKEALEIIREKSPDLIITDIMMPRLNGFDLAKAVRNNSETQHIPIIFLTAKTSEEDKIHGLELGAVDYITKPFNNRELILKITNLLSTRKDFKDRQWQQLLVESFDKNELTEDESFLKDLYQKTISGIENPGFGVTELALKMNMSERNLYRRVSQVMDDSVGTFIREIRLRRTDDLLKNNRNMTIAEAAYKVGYKSPKQFSKAYSDIFGRSPK
jgi:DNA-binding response OmpR family regulator